MNKDWDPSLMFVMVGAIGVNAITFRLILKKYHKPLYTETYSVPKNNSLDLRLICGAFIFGLGWGLGSLCPGPGMITFFTVPYVLFWIIALGIG